MHSAPSVSYPVGRSRFAGGLLLAGWSLGAAAVSAWACGSPWRSWQLAAACIAVVTAGAVAAWGWWRSGIGTLRWDGESWRWDACRGDTLLDVAFDGQQVLLVRLSSDAPVCWLWLDRSRDPGRWDDLRRAVYSRARSRALSGRVPPAATP